MKKIYMRDQTQEQRELYSCPECEEHLVVKKGETYVIIKKSRGNRVPVELEVQNPAGSPIRITCGKCKRTSAIFVTLRTKPNQQKRKIPLRKKLVLT